MCGREWQSPLDFLHLQLHFSHKPSKKIHCESYSSGFSHYLRSPGFSHHSNDVKFPRHPAMQSSPVHRLLLTPSVELRVSRSGIWIEKREARYLECNVAPKTNRIPLERNKSNTRIVMNYICQAFLGVCYTASNCS